jgi:hypothetical protein
VKAVSIFGADGRLVERREGHLQARLSVNTGHLATGTYLVVVELDGGAVARKKVVVQR